MRQESPEREAAQLARWSAELEQIGTRLGPYRLLAPLGAGGMATVFVAEHMGLEKRVAVKVLRTWVGLDEDVRRRFVLEGIIASRVRHPNVVDVTDVGEDRGHAYLVMELLEGESLAARMARRGVMPIERALEILLPIIAGLAVAHRAGVVHRDVKPENIFLATAGERREISKLLDFGISRVDALGAKRTTDDGVIRGTAHYMAPEQARGDHVDGRADQYALAVVLFEALSGSLPYVADGSNLLGLIAEVARGGALPLTARWPEAPRDLSDVLAKALSNRPEDRHANIEDFGRQLLRFASSRAVRRFRELVDPGWSSMTLEEQSSAATIDASGVQQLVRIEARTEAVTTADDAPIAAEVEPASTPARASGRRRATASHAITAVCAGAVGALLSATVMPRTSVEPTSRPATVELGPVGSPPPTTTPAALVVVSVTAEPAHARITLDGRSVGEGMVSISLPRGQRHRLTVTADGFAPWETQVGDADADYELELRPLTTFDR